MLPAFHCTTGVLGDSIFFFFFLLFAWVPLLFSLQVTSRGPPTRISLAIYSHCHLFQPPRSARFRATRLVPYLIPSATAMEKQKREREAAGSNSSSSRQTAKRRHTARESRALGSFGVVFSPLTFFFFSSPFLCLSFAVFLHLRSLHLSLSWGGALNDCRLLGSHRRSGTSIQTEKESAGNSTMGMSDDATRMYS